MPELKTFNDDFAWEDFDNAIKNCRDHKLFTEANLLERVKESLVTMVNPAIDFTIEQMLEISVKSSIPESTRPMLLQDINDITQILQPILDKLQIELRPKRP